MYPIEIKAIVRYRDGFRCTECGMTNDEHIQVHGRSLDVHRLIPGSPYTIEGCVTLCRPCHRTKPRSPKGMARQTRMTLVLHREVTVAIRLAATNAGIGTSTFVNRILRQELAAEIEDARKYLPQRGDPVPQ